MTTFEKILESKLAKLFSRQIIVCEGSIIEEAAIGDKVQEALKRYMVALHDYNSIAPLVTARYIGDAELDYAKLKNIPREIRRKS